MVVFHRVICSLGITLLLVGPACRKPDDTSPTKTTPSDPPHPDAIAPEAITAFVGDTVTFDASASVGDSFHWIFSHGHSAEGAIAEVTFDEPGHFTAFLTAEDATGRSDTDVTAITVTWPPLDTVPVSSSSLVQDGGILYAVLADLGELIAVDLQTMAIVQRTPTCIGPRSVAVGHGARFVACPEVDTVMRVDDAGNSSIVFPHGSRPFGIVVGPDAVWVALQGTGSIAEISPSGTLQRTVPVAPDLRAIATDGDTLLAARWRSPDTGGLVMRLDGNLAPLGETTLPLDPGPDSDTNARGLPSLLSALTIRPDGRVAAIGGLKSNIERGLFREGNPLTFETVNRADLRIVSLDDREGPLGTQIATALFDDRDQVIAAAWSPLGDWLYTLSPGMETVDVRDSYTLALSGAVPGVGTGADALWVSDDGQTLAVLAQLTRTLRLYDISSIAVPVLRADIDLLPETGEPLDAEVLAGKILFGRSVDPRMSGGGYLSCASCHPEGDHDGRTWDFTDRGEGLRNTIGLLGRAGSSPIHWSANFDELADFENDIRYGQGGQGFLDDAAFEATEDPLGAPKAGLSAELDALAAYMQSLTTPIRSPHRAADGALTTQAQLGEQIFLDPALRCIECHPKPNYTDSQWLSPGEPLLHDVGTLSAGSGSRRGEPLTGLDTPSLLGLSSSAPYLHDGSAATVREVLTTRNVDDQHGVVSGLDEEALSALEVFLLSL